MTGVNKPSKERSQNPHPEKPMSKKRSKKQSKKKHSKKTRPIVYKRLSTPPPLATMYWPTMQIMGELHLTYRRIDASGRVLDIILGQSNQDYAIHIKSIMRPLMTIIEAMSHAKTWLAFTPTMLDNPTWSTPTVEPPVTQPLYGALQRFLRSDAFSTAHSWAREIYNMTDTSRPTLGQLCLAVTILRLALLSRETWVEQDRELCVIFADRMTSV